MIHFRFIFLLFLPCFLHAPAPADIVQQPAVKWRFKTRGPVFSTPVVEGNTAYFGSLDSSLYAIDANTGKIKWTFPTRSEIRSNVVVYKENVLLLSGNGVFYAIDKNSGKLAWRKIFDYSASFLGERRYDFADYYHSSPVVHNNIIYFGTANNYFNALDANTGEQVWSFKASDIIHSTPVVYKDKIYFGCFDGNVYALNLHSGNLVWKFKSVGQVFFPNGEMQGSPAVSSKYGLIYIGGRDYNFYALDAERGYAHWNKKFEIGWALSASVNDSVVYAGTSDDRVLVAYDAFSGRQLWKTDVKFNIFGNCAFSPSLVYVATVMGKLYAIDSQTGSIRWSFMADGFVANHLKYFTAEDAFRTDIGTILRTPADFIAMEYSLGGMFSTPVWYEGGLIVSSTGGTVYYLK